MKKLKHFLLITLFIFNFSTTFSKSIDSLYAYPNPFSISALINFNLAQSDTITLKVFDALGNPIKTFYQSTVLPSGTYNVTLLGDSLVNGFYFIRLDIGSAKKINSKLIKVGNTSSVSTTTSTKTKIAFFPNPVGDYLTIPVEGKKTIQFKDLAGRIIKSIVTNQQIISVKDLPNGQYFITLITNNNEILTTEKILKID